MAGSEAMTTEIFPQWQRGAGNLWACGWHFIDDASESPVASPPVLSEGAKGGKSFAPVNAPIFTATLWQDKWAAGSGFSQILIRLPL